LEQLNEFYLEDSWKQAMSEAFAKPSFTALQHFLNAEYKNNTLFYPPVSKIFEAFNRTQFHQVKIVLLGQDPYHGLNQAHGLSFSVNEGVPFPPSLKNIFKGLQVDYPDYKIPINGNLSNWANQGVLLLNATLTVRAGEAGSHQKKGWEEFTDEAIKQLSLQREHLVFLLWGNYAQSKSDLINTKKHLTLQAPHPSPLSAHRGFFNCKHFSQANAYLISHQISPINW